MSTNEVLDELAKKMIKKIDSITLYKYSYNIYVKNVLIKFIFTIILKLILGITINYVFNDYQLICYKNGYIPPSTPW